MEVDGATCDVCCLCLPSCFFVVVVAVGSSNDATTSFFLDLLPTQPKTRYCKRREGKGGGTDHCFKLFMARQGSANHNQAINLSLIRHQMTLKAA